MVEILDCRPLAEKIKNEVLNDYKKLNKSINLAVFLVGDDPASKIYVRNKEKLCLELGIQAHVHNLPHDIEEEILLDKIFWFNFFDSCRGILVQLPLPAHINRNNVIQAINPDKDVDCFHPVNLGKLCLGECFLIPPTSAAVLYVLDYCKIDLTGKHVVIINDTIILGRPLSHLLLTKSATVTICNRYTLNLPEICRSADVIVTAVGKRDYFVLNNAYCKQGVVIIDVGISKFKGKTVGDVNIDDVSNARLVTKVPYGIGALTIPFLLKNLVK